MLILYSEIPKVYWKPWDWVLCYQTIRLFLSPFYISWCLLCIWRKIAVLRYLDFCKCGSCMGNIAYKSVGCFLYLLIWAQVYNVEREIVGKMWKHEWMKIWNNQVKIRNPIFCWMDCIAVKKDVLWSYQMFMKVKI